MTHEEKVYQFHIRYEYETEVLDRSLPHQLSDHGEAIVRPDYRWASNWSASVIRRNLIRALDLCDRGVRGLGREDRRRPFPPLAFEELKRRYHALPVTEGFDPIDERMRHIPC